MWPMFGTTMIILAALPFAVWLMMYVFGGSDAHMPADLRLIMIEAVAYIAAIMAPSRMYRTWNLRNEGIYYAMLPASKAEKFCSALLFSLIVCPLAVYLGSLVLDVFLTVVSFGPWQEWIWQGEMGFPFTFDMSRLSDYAAAEEGAEAFLHFGWMYQLCCWVGYISTVLMFLFTSTIFKKHKVLQTILWLYVINFAISIILMPVMVAVFSDSSFMDWFMQLPDRMSGEQMVNWIFGVTFGFDVLLTALFGWLSWRRLNRMAY
ncbi:MAG: hypothetical protein IKC19_05930 [Bacteroidales bacterium]|nr:hypothetical protein [Bacteroidales bacterium]